MTSDWISFFTTLTQVSIGLAGLLFVSFSIYFSRFEIDELEMTIGTMYYIEVISAFSISLSAILPPHWWWVGAGGVAIFYIWYTKKSEKVISKYSHEFRQYYDAGGSKKTDNQVTEYRKRAEIYKLYKLLTEDKWIIWVRTIMLLLCAIIGILFTLNVRDMSFFDTWAVQLTGVLAALYMVSSVIGVWYFILNFEKRNKVVIDLVDSKTDAGQNVQDEEISQKVNNVSSHLFKETAKTD